MALKTFKRRKREAEDAQLEAGRAQSDMGAAAADRANDPNLTRAPHVPGRPERERRIGEIGEIGPDDPIGLRLEKERLESVDRVVPGETPRERIERTGRENRPKSAAARREGAADEARLQELLAASQGRTLTAAELAEQDEIRTRVSVRGRHVGREERRESAERREAFDARHAARVKRVEDENVKRAERGRPPIPIPQTPEQREAGSQALQDRFTFKEILRSNERAGGDEEDLETRIEALNTGRTARGLAPVRLDPSTAKDGIKARAVIDARGMPFEDFAEFITPPDREIIDTNIKDSSVGEAFEEEQRKKVAIATDEPYQTLSPDEREVELAKSDRKLDRLRHQFASSPEFEGVARSPYPDGQGVGEVWEAGGLNLTRNVDGEVKSLGKVERPQDKAAADQEKDLTKRLAEARKHFSGLGIDNPSRADLVGRILQQSGQDEFILGALKGFLNGDEEAEPAAPVTGTDLSHIGSPGWRRESGSDDILVNGADTFNAGRHANGLLYPKPKDVPEAERLPNGTWFINTKGDLRERIINDTAVAAEPQAAEPRVGGPIENVIQPAGGILAAQITSEIGNVIETAVEAAKRGAARTQKGRLGRAF